MPIRTLMCNCPECMHACMSPARHGTGNGWGRAARWAASGPRPLPFSPAHLIVPPHQQTKQCTVSLSCAPCFIGKRQSCRLLSCRWTGSLQVVAVSPPFATAMAGAQPAAKRQRTDAAAAPPAPSAGDDERSRKSGHCEVATRPMRNETNPDQPHSGPTHPCCTAPSHPALPPALPGGALHLPYPFPTTPVPFVWLETVSNASAGARKRLELAATRGPSSLDEAAAHPAPCGRWAAAGQTPLPTPWRSRSSLSYTRNFRTRSTQSAQSARPHPLAFSGLSEFHQKFPHAEHAEHAERAERAERASTQNAFSYHGASRQG
eukprot:gene7982-biopygen1550